MFNHTFVFRTDASLQIGFGHLSRCITLAKYFNKLSAKCIFLVTSETLNLYKNFLSDFTVHIINQASENDDANECINLTKNQKNLIFIVDSYSLSASWEKIIIKNVKLLVVIDDLNRKHVAQIILDYNVKDNYYNQYIDSEHNKLKLLGPDYAILKDDFIQLRKDLPTWQSRLDRINICFGGTDYNNATATILNTLKTMDKKNSFDVILGSSYQNIKKLNADFLNYKHFSILHNPENLPSLLAKSFLAVGAGGTMTWERCILGLPAIVIATADNQIPASKILHDLNIIKYLGEFKNFNSSKFIKEFTNLIDDQDQLMQMSNKAMLLVDGRGTKKVAANIINNLITVAEATLNDCEQIFNWRNHIKNRSAAIDQKEISFSEHKTWFKNTVNSQTRKLYIAGIDNNPIGVLRLDYQESFASVSIYLIPEYHNSKLGLALLLKAREIAESKAKKLLAQIRHDNLRSESIFKDAGYFCIDTGKNITYSSWELII